METELYKLVPGNLFQWNGNVYKIIRFITKKGRDGYNKAFCKVKRLATKKIVDIRVTHTVEKI